MPRVIALILPLLFSAVASADILHTFDFVTDFSRTTSITNTAVNGSTFNSAGFATIKTGGSGRVGQEFTYIGPAIDTTGYNNIRLVFTYVDTLDLEYDSLDSFYITGTGISFDGDTANSGPTSPLLFTGVDNGLLNISSLVFTSFVNANAEQVLFGDATIEGDAMTAAVPEPSSVAVFTIGAVGIAFRRRRAVGSATAA
ncbi:MAG: PEP-CTERM sorting domain-containing protein [Planctomycetaceae bacterium]